MVMQCNAYFKNIRVEYSYLGQAVYYYAGLKIKAIRKQFVLKYIYFKPFSNI